MSGKFRERDGNFEFGYGSQRLIAVGVEVGKSSRAALTAANELISEEMHELTDDER